MIVTRKHKKETIEVIHNNLDEMHENLKQLEKGGWSPNTRCSVAGIRLFEEEMEPCDVHEFEKANPSVTVYYPEKNSFLRTWPYVYFTKHERVIGE
ncbi:hypothetical protein ACQKMD_01355 [Viridibacillus sp. NPDC096237]|uniref:hypothetical protein n=1 Tax=Viridibacillus sp. NPDC096237 TaxID=3390721 RepID=UPI003D014FAA